MKNNFMFEQEVTQQKGFHVRDDSEFRHDDHSFSEKVMECNVPVMTHRYFRRDYMISSLTTTIHFHRKYIIT